MFVSMIILPLNLMGGLQGKSVFINKFLTFSYKMNSNGFQNEKIVSTS